MHSTPVDTGCYANPWLHFDMADTTVPVSTFLYSYDGRDSSTGPPAADVPYVGRLVCGSNRKDEERAIVFETRYA